MMSGILCGLEHLHEKGLVHCDLKPSNVLLQGETPKITDFGVSRALRATVHTKHLSGTPAYMPPEAIDGHLSKFSDLWAAGVMLYVMVSGRLPFPQQSMGPLMLALKEQEPDPLPASVPEDIKQVIRRALQKDPHRRFASAGEMRQSLVSASLDSGPMASVYAQGKSERTGTIILPRIESLLASPVPAVEPHLAPQPAVLVEQRAKTRPQGQRADGLGAARRVRDGERRWRAP